MIKHLQLKKVLAALLTIAALFAGQQAFATSKTVIYRIGSSTYSQSNHSYTLNFVIADGSDTPFDGGQDTYQMTINESSLNNVGGSNGAGDYTVNFSDGFSLRLQWEAGSNVYISDQYGVNISAVSNSQHITYTVTGSSGRYFVTHLDMQNNEGSQWMMTIGNQVINPDFDYAYQLQESYDSRGSFGRIAITYTDAPPIILLTSPSANTYNITSKRDLAVLAAYVNGGHNDCRNLTFLQTQDIDCDNTYTPIGYYNNTGDNIYFRGTYDGQSHFIRNITVNRTGNTDADNCVGLFGYITWGTVQNVVLANSTFTGYNYVGGIVGYCDGNISEYSTVRNCRVDNSVIIKAGHDGAMNHGGIVGYNFAANAKVIGCLCGATVSHNDKSGCEYFGGIVGQNYSGTITDCLYTGSIVTGNDNIGAIVGNYKKTITNITNNYYTHISLGGVNGSDMDGARRARTVTLGEGVNIVGATTVYNVSGITAIGTGNYAMRLGNNPIFSGATQTLNLTYNGTVPTGYSVTYTATAGTISGNTLTMPNQDVTVNTTLAPITYNITYNLNGGSVATDNPATYNIETPSFTLNNPTRTGYTFAGWTGTGLTEATQTVTIALGSTGDRSYTATWAPITYSITYDLDGGSVATANPSTYNIETTSFTLNNPTRMGYTFAGWIGTGLTEATQTVTIAHGSTGDRSYTATWTPITYNITYNLDGGSVATANPTTYNIETPSFTLNNPIRAGYTFTGWTGTGLNGATQTVTIAHGSTGGRSYTAHWNANISSLSTLLGDGSGANPYCIMNNEVWEQFASMLNDPASAYLYDDRHYKLGADINVTTWVATNPDHPFRGTFDGNGHTIHVTFEQTEDKGIALFQYVGDGCDIHDLTVDGTITSNYQFAAGIVSVITKGDNGQPNAVSINRCRSHVTFNLGVDGDATSGGLVAFSQDNVMLTMQDCLFDGGFVSNTATHCSGMVGYQANNGFTYIENSYVSPNGMNLISNGNNRNFCRPGSSYFFKISNCYHTDPDFGDGQGEYVGASPDPYYVAGLLGNWGVSGNQPVPTTVNMMIPNCTLFSGFNAHSCNTPYNNNGNTEETYTQLVDDNRSTKWCVSYPYSTHGGWQPISLDFSDTIPFAPKGYILTTGDESKYHSDRLPKVWNLYGWNVSTDSWDLLDRHEGGSDALPRLNCADKLYLLKNYESLTTTYKKYKFEIEEISRETSNTDDFVFELGEIRLLGVVSDADANKLEHCFINGILPSYDYTGAALSIDYRVTDCHYNLLVEDTHYTKSITLNNSNVNEIADAGVYTITFNGIAPYTGSKSISFAVIDPTATYSITLAGADHGSVSTETTSNVAAGDDVWLDINPESGYMLQSISATTASGDVEVAGGVWYSGYTDYVYFRMPAADVTVTPTFAAISDLSVNMPADKSDYFDPMSVKIPTNVTTIKVYDDGGSNAPSSANCNGTMSICADQPGTILEFSGSVDFGRLAIYNSSAVFDNPIAVFDADHPTINKVITTGNGALLCYIGNGYDSQKAGLNLTVKVLGNNGDYGVTINNVTGGNVTIDGKITATKKINDEVALEVVVTAGYLCTGYSMEPDCKLVTGGVWHESPTEAYFVMPADDITITPNFTNTLTAAGGLYINMPALNKCQPKTVGIPSGVSSFKVYDDGGASGNYSRYSDGVLVLTAPEGYHLKLSGSVTCQHEGIAHDYLKVFDGDAITAAPLGNPDGMGNSNGQNIGTLTSSGRSMTLYFHSGDHAMAGLDLLVEVTDTFDGSYTITFDDSNIPAGCSIGITGTVSVGQTITTNVTCDANHLLNAFTVTDAAGNEVALSDGLCWHNGNNGTATFTMLPRNLFVNYEFVEKGDQYIKIPKSETLVVTVPEGITTLKIYDDGGPDTNYSNGCDGYLLLTAPDGKVWQLSGTVKSEHGKDFMSPYNGSTATTLIDGCSYGKATGEDIGALVTLGYQMLLRFRSDYATTDNGLDLTATVIDPIIRTVEGYANAPAGQDLWAFISTPLKHYVVPQKVDNFLPMDETSPDYDLYRFNQSAALEWQNYKAHTGVFALESGSGYLYANKYTKTIQFGGSVCAEDSKEVPLVYDANADLPGWNLVGNPLMAPAYVNRPYYQMNEFGSDIEPVDDYSRWPIQMCTGIMVEAEGEGERITFSKTPQQQSSNQGGLHVIVATHQTTRDGSGSTTVQDKAIVSFNPGSRLGKFYFGAQNGNIYIPQDGEDYAIAFSNGQGEMPINFKAKENGEYTITVNPENVEMSYLHLIDHITGADIDLLAAKAPEPVEGPTSNNGVSTGSTTSYTFTAKTTDYESRFKLVFSTHGDGPSTGSGAFAYIHNGDIIINGEGTLQVVDVMGRIVLSGDAMNRVSTGGMTAGVYVLRLINGNDVKTQKIVIE